MCSKDTQFQCFHAFNHSIGLFVLIKELLECFDAAFILLLPRCECSGLKVTLLFEGLINEVFNQTADPLCDLLCVVLDFFLFLLKKLFFCVFLLLVLSDTFQRL